MRGGLKPELGRAGGAGTAGTTGIAGWGGDAPVGSFALAAGSVGSSSGVKTFAGVAARGGSGTVLAGGVLATSAEVACVPRSAKTTKNSAPRASIATASTMSVRRDDVGGDSAGASEIRATGGARSDWLDTRSMFVSDGRGGIDEGIERCGSSPPSRTRVTARVVTE